MKELHLTKDDFKIDWFSGTGKGGQHRNKHQNCCRITHIETSLRAQGTEGRDRITNQRVAFNELSKRIISYYSVPKERRNNSDTIRNYHAVRNEVHDKASGLKLSYKAIVIDGNIEKMINARLSVMCDKELANNEGGP